MALFDKILERLRVARALGAHRPVVTGAHALGLGRTADVVWVRCQATVLPAFRSRLVAVYGERRSFQLTPDGAELVVMGTAVRISGASTPTRAQVPVRRHMVMAQLLRILGAPLSQRVQAARPAGALLGPVFASALGVADVLELERASPVQVRAAWAAVPARARPAVVSAAVEAVLASEPAEEDDASAEHLLRTPAALLKRRDSRWVDADQLLRPGSMPLTPRPKKR